MQSSTPSQSMQKHTGQLLHCPLYRISLDPMPKSVFRAPTTPRSARLLQSWDFDSFLFHKWVGYLPPLLHPKSLTTAKQNPIWLAIPSIILGATIALLIVWKVLKKSLLKSHIGKKNYPSQNFLEMLIGIHTPAVCQDSQEKLRTMKLRISSTENKILLQLHFLVHVKLDYDWHASKQALILSQGQSLSALHHSKNHCEGMEGGYLSLDYVRETVQIFCSTPVEPKSNGFHWFTQQYVEYLNQPGAFQVPIQNIITRSSFQEDSEPLSNIWMWFSQYDNPAQNLQCSHSRYRGENKKPEILTPY